MQTAQFKKQVVDLGRAKGFTVSKKAKFVMRGFCRTGCGWVMLGADHQCLACGTKVTNLPTNENMIRRFETILQVNKPVIDQWVPDDYENLTLKLPVSMGKKTYFVPLRYFQEFENIQMSDDKDYESFFDNIKKKCHCAAI